MARRAFDSLSAKVSECRASAPVELGTGTFALQAHDPGCKVDYKDIKVEQLP